MKSFLLSSLMFIGTLNGQGAPPAAVPPTEPAVVTPTTPAQPAAPVTPQAPPATPQYGAPTQPQQPYNPYAPPAYNPYGMAPGFGFGQLDPQNLKCEFGQAMCRNRKITMTPGQGFKLYCQQPGQCDGLDLTLNVAFEPGNFGSAVSDVTDFIFDVPTRNVKIRINSMAGQNVEVDNLHCKVPGACNGLTMTTSFGVEAWNMNVHCDQPMSCDGCTVNGQSCYMLSMMNGNNGGFGYGYGGFGYQNTPNAPAAPGQPAAPAQQPGFGAPAMPQQGVPAYPQFNPYQQWI